MSSASPESKYDPHQVISSLVKEVALKSEQVATDARPTADVRARAVAELLDSNDELAAFRDQFNIPPADPEASTSADSTYLCGNSLGLQPKRTEAYLLEELGKWKRCGVEGHFLGKRPWATIDETVTGLNAQLVGAESPNEVVVMNSLSVNLHLLLTAFYRPTPTRHKIFIEDGAFCSDYHVVKSQVSKRPPPAACSRPHCSQPSSPTLTPSPPPPPPRSFSPPHIRSSCTGMTRRRRW